MLPRVPSLLLSSKTTSPTTVSSQRGFRFAAAAAAGAVHSSRRRILETCKRLQCCVQQHQSVLLSCEYSLKINILALLLVCRAGAGSGANPSGIADDAVTKAREKLNEGKARFGDLFKGKVNRPNQLRLHDPNFFFFFFFFFFLLKVIDILRLELLLLAPSS
jgi:hypothetical protein